MPELAELQRSRRVRWFIWRGLLFVTAFGCGFAGFVMGAEAADRPGIPDAGILTQVYYTVGLFVLGGLDLGMPTGGTATARALLWIGYFGAPAITASAVIEGLLRAIDPNRWRMRRLRRHIVIGGAGRLAGRYVHKLRAAHAYCPIVVVEERTNLPQAHLIREKFRVSLVTGDVRSRTLLHSVHPERAKRVLLLTGDDFANLDAATSILSMAPDIGKDLVVHVADLRFMRLMAHTRVATECTIFNTYQIAASHLVVSQLIPHFERTEFRDLLVLAGFGRLGQTILDELQRSAPDSLAEVVIIDLEGDERAMVFDEQVGFSGEYDWDVVDGDVGDVRVWSALETKYEFDKRAPVFVIGSGKDGTNLRIALRLSKRYEDSLSVARIYSPSAFASEISQQAGVHVFSVAELIDQSMPAAWFE